MFTTQDGQEFQGGVAGDSALLAHIKEAVLGLEYGTLIISIRNGQVVGLERHEKRRLALSSSRRLDRNLAHPVTRKS